MDNDIFSHFPDRETFDRYWNENYVPVTYEDVATVFRDFVKSAEGHIYLSDYEEKGVERGKSYYSIRWCWRD